jgi:hypothetical protein
VLYAIQTVDRTFSNTFFLGRLDAGNVAAINSTTEAIDGTFKSKARRTGQCQRSRPPCAVVRRARYRQDDARGISAADGYIFAGAGAVLILFAIEPTAGRPAGPCFG